MPYSTDALKPSWLQFIICLSSKLFWQVLQLFAILIPRGHQISPLVLDFRGSWTRDYRQKHPLDYLRKGLNRQVWFYYETMQRKIQPSCSFIRNPDTLKKAKKWFYYWFPFATHYIFLASTTDGNTSMSWSPQSKNFYFLKLCLSSYNRSFVSHHNPELKWKLFQS